MTKEIDEGLEEEIKQYEPSSRLTLYIPDQPTTRQLAELTYSCVEELIARTKGMARAHLEVGMILAFIKDNRLYLNYGEGFTTFQDFLTDIDIGIKKPEADHLIRLWKKFGEYLQATGKVVSVRRLLAIAPFCKTPQQIDSWVCRAEILPEFAFQDEVKEARGGIPTDTCEHPSFTIWKKCTVCHKWFLADNREENHGRGQATRVVRRSESSGNSARERQEQTEADSSRENERRRSGRHETELHQENHGGRQE